MEDWEKERLNELNFQIDNYEDKVGYLSIHIGELKTESYKIEGYIKNLKEEKEDILKDIEEREKEEEQENIEKITCSTKCHYHLNPKSCKKTDKTRCPFRNGVNLLTYNNYFEILEKFKNSIFR